MLQVQRIYEFIGQDMSITAEKAMAQHRAQVRPPLLWVPDWGLQSRGMHCPVQKVVHLIVLSIIGFLQNKRPKHTYNWDDTRLDRQGERARFKFYTDHFNVPAEKI